MVALEDTVRQGQQLWELLWETLTPIFVSQVHSSTLGLYRIVFSTLLLVQFMKWNFIFDVIQETHLTITYPGWSWIQPLDPGPGRLIHLIGTLASILLILGLFTRISTTCCLVVFVYLFALDVSNYGNYLVLMTYILFTAQFLPWGSWGSLDRLWARNRKNCKSQPPLIQYWQLLALQLLTVLPYAFGALARLNADWLWRAQPVTLWFERHPRVPKFDAVPLLVAWFSLAFHAGAAPLLFWEPTRYSIALPACFLFHINNKVIFGQGLYPYVMIGSLCLFLPTQGPAQLVSYVLGQPFVSPHSSKAPRPIERCERAPVQQEGRSEEVVASTALQQANAGGGHRRVPSYVNVPFITSGGSNALPSGSANVWSGTLDGDSAASNFVPLPATTRDLERANTMSKPVPERPCALKRTSLHLRLFWTISVLFHILWPLRHIVLYRGSPSWHEAGHLGAWHIGTRTKFGWSYLIAEASDGKLYEIAPAFDNFVLKAQRIKLTSWPHSMLQYAGRMRDIFQAAGISVTSIRAHSCMSLNGHSGRMLFNPDVNLLHHVGRYELMGTSGLGTLLYDWATAPQCDVGGAYRRNLSLRQRIVKTLSRVYAAASVRESLLTSVAYGEEDVENYGFQVVHVDANGAQQLAYKWKPEKHALWRSKVGLVSTSSKHTLVAPHHQHVDVDESSNDDDDFLVLDFASWPL